VIGKDDVDASAASMLVVKYLTPRAMTRVTTAGALRRAGFVVVHSPSKTNRLHVSVFPPLATGDQAEWDDELATGSTPASLNQAAREVTMSTLPMMGNLGWAPALGLIDEMLEFLGEALDIAMQQDLPPVRRELMRTASEAVRELSAC
jgi:hypothetical protein